MKDELDNRLNFFYAPICVKQSTTMLKNRSTLIEDDLNNRLKFLNWYRIDYMWSIIFLTYTI